MRWRNIIHSGDIRRTQRQEPNKLFTTTDHRWQWQMAIISPIADLLSNQNRPRQILTDISRLVQDII